MPDDRNPQAHNGFGIICRSWGENKPSSKEKSTLFLFGDQPVAIPYPVQVLLGPFFESLVATFPPSGLVVVDSAILAGVQVRSRHLVAIRNHQSSFLQWGCLYQGKAFS